MGGRGRKREAARENERERLIDDRGSSERNADRSLSSVGHTHTNTHTQEHGAL